VRGHWADPGNLGNGGESKQWSGEER